MIKLTRLNGDFLYVNQSLIEKIDVVPNTIITMNSQVQYIVSESIEEINNLIVDFLKKITFTSREL